jgi:hypothetical protein
MLYWVSMHGKGVMITEAENEEELVIKIRAQVQHGTAMAFPTPDDTQPAMAEWLKTAPRDVLLDPEKDIPAELWLGVNVGAAARQAAKANMN